MYIYIYIHINVAVMYQFWPMQAKGNNNNECNHVFCDNFPGVQGIHGNNENEMSKSVPEGLF